MASIEWSDELGFASLDNGLPDPGSRFMGWEVLTDPIVRKREGLGTGIPYAYRFRSDYGAKFSLREIPDTAARQVVLARLRRHLKEAGTVTINTGDVEGRIFDCYLYPGGDVVLGYDPKIRKRSVTLSLMNADLSTDLVVQYP